MVLSHGENKSRLISLGVITKVRGNKGEVAIGLISRHTEHYKSVKNVVVRPPGEGDYKLTIEKIWSYRNNLILKFKGCDSIEQAEGMVGNEILVAEEELLLPEDDDYYVFQLIGLKVFSAGGDFLGNIVEIMYTGGTDVLVVKKGEKEYLIPMVKEYLKKLDLESKEIIIKPPEGLLEINEI